MSLILAIKHKFAKQLHWVSEQRRRLYNTWFLLHKSPKSYILINGSFRQKGWNIIPTNIGDDLNSYIVEGLTDRKVFNYSESFHLFPRKNYMVIGSLVDWKTNRHSVIWGSGVMDASRGGMVKPKSVCAVRGKLTRSYLMEHGVACPESFGDPALLLPFLYNKPITNNHKIGLVPHYVDLYSDIVKQISQDDRIVLLDVQNYGSFQSFIDTLRSCDFIISSSLHGLIIADAYGIPNVWVKFSDKVLGDDFKYYDYFSSVNRSARPFRIDQCADIETAIARIRDYQRIQFNPESLVASCPLPIIGFGDRVKEHKIAT